MNVSKSLAYDNIGYRYLNLVFWPQKFISRQKLRTTYRKCRKGSLYKKERRKVMLLKSIIHWDISDLSRGLKVLYKARKGHLSCSPTMELSSRSFEVKDFHYCMIMIHGSLTSNVCLSNKWLAEKIPWQLTSQQEYYQRELFRLRLMTVLTGKLFCLSLLVVKETAQCGKHPIGIPSEKCDFQSSKSMFSLKNRHWEKHPLHFVTLCQFMMELLARKLYCVLFFISGRVLLPLRKGYVVVASLLDICRIC